MMGVQRNGPKYSIKNGIYRDRALRSFKACYFCKTSFTIKYVDIIQNLKINFKTKLNLYLSK